MPWEGTSAAARSGVPLFTFKRLCFELGIAVHACNPTTQALVNQENYKFEASLWDLVRLYLKVKHAGDAGQLSNSVAECLLPFQETLLSIPRATEGERGLERRPAA